MLRGVERLIRDCATSTPAMFPPRVGSIGSCVHRCRVDACATGGQRCAPALATEVAAVPGGLDREAFSGCSGELYQSTTCAHSKRTQDDPYCQWVPPRSRLTGCPSHATPSRAGIPCRRAMAAGGVAHRLLSTKPSSRSEE